MRSMVEGAHGGSEKLLASWPDLFRPSTSLNVCTKDVDTRDIGERSDAVVRTAMRGHDGPGKSRRTHNARPWQLPLRRGALRSASAVRQIRAMPLFAMPQGHGQRVRRQRRCGAGCVPLDARREQRGALRFSSGAKFLDFVLQHVRIAGPAQHSQRPRNDYSGRIAGRRSANQAFNDRPFGFPRRMVRPIRRIPSGGLGLFV
jgi:hypothetical protein